MSDFLKMYIFFVVATFATVVLATLMSVALVYLIRILRTVDRLSGEVAEEARAFRQDLAEVRASAKKSGSEIVSLIRALVRYAKRLLGNKRSR